MRISLNIFLELYFYQNKDNNDNAVISLYLEHMFILKEINKDWLTKKGNRQEIKCNT